MTYYNYTTGYYADKLDNLLILKDALDDYLNTLDFDKDREEYKAIDEDVLCIMDITALIEQLTEKFDSNTKYTDLFVKYINRD